MANLTGSSFATFGYLALALFLAMSLNATNRFFRACGTLTAALNLAMLAVSIFAADFDGTYQNMPPASSTLDAFKPLILNIQAVIATAASIFLFWAAGAQVKRRVVKESPLANTASSFGLVSRYAHWIAATLILCLVPMGLFVSVLQADSPDRAEYLAAHQTLGLIVLAVVAIRLVWFLASPPPEPSPSLTELERLLSRAVHIGLYVLILAFPVSGILMSASGEGVQFFGWPLLPPIPSGKHPPSLWASAHDLVLPLLFYALIAAHIGAVLKHRFVDGRGDVHRMLT
jgi:cytochrome b561